MTGSFPFADSIKPVDFYNTVSKIHVLIFTFAFMQNFLLVVCTSLDMMSYK